MRKLHLSVLAIVFFMGLAFCFASFPHSHQGASSTNATVNPKSRVWYKFLQEEKNVRLNVPDVPKFYLSNGIRVDYIVDHSLPKVDFRLYLKGGKFAEQEDQQAKGVGNVWVETLVFSGSQEYPRDVLASYLENRATSFSASSGLERSVVSLSSFSKFFVQDLKVVLNILKQPRFAQEDLNFIKKQMEQGLQKREEKPATIAYLMAKKLLWQNSIRGEILINADVQKISQENILQWQKLMWNPKRMHLLISGDFDLEKIKNILEQQLGTLPTQNNLSPLPQEKTKTSTDIYFLTKSIPQSTVLFMTKGMPHTSSEYYALKVFDYILGGGSFDSYLPQQIRTKRGWAYTVYSAYSTWKDNGSIHIFAQTQSKNTANVIKETQVILNSPQRYVDETSVQKAKQAIINRFVFLYSTPMQLIGQKLSTEWDGLPPDYLNDFVENIGQVNIDQVLQVAQKYYSAENFFIVVVGNQSVKSSLSSINLSSGKKQGKRNIVDTVFPH